MRARLVYDEPKWKGYDVVLDCLARCIRVGRALYSKRFAGGRKRPVVVCQHGLEGLPRDTIEGPERQVVTVL